MRAERTWLLLLGALPLAGLLALWQGVAAAGLAPSALLPSPGAVFARLLEQARNPVFLAHAATTLLRLFAGFGIALILGVTLGLAAASNRWAEALALLDQTERLIEEKGYTSFLPELLRLKGSILLTMPERRVADAEECFTRSLQLSRAQGARVWELRTATDLAAHWAGQGRAGDARALLQPVFEQFSDGLDTPDLKAAERVLTSLR